MPVELPNGKVGITALEIIPFYGTWSNVEKKLQRGQLTRLQRGGNGRILLIDFDTLEQSIQYALGDPRNIGHVFEKYYRTDREAVNFYRQHQLTDGSYLAADHQDRYIINASVLKAIINFRADIEKERKRKGANLLGIPEVLRVHTIDFQKTLKAKHKDEHTLPESLKHFKRVLNDFEKKGYTSLISGKHGNDNSRKVYDNTIALLESMFAKDNTKPTATDVHRRYDDFIAGHPEIINNTTGEVFNPAEFKPLSKTTVTNYLSDWQSAIGTHAIRSGDRQKYMQAFKPHHSLNKPNFAGSIISIDDRQPPFKMPDGKRIWFYNGIDLGSEAFTTWVYGKSKENIILDFYRQMVRNYAAWGLCLPAELEAEMSLNSSYVDTFLQEGAMFQHVRIEANNARGKRIEAYYRPLRYALEKKREGWLARPFARDESNQAGSHEVKAMYYDDIVEGCLQDIETWNNMPHSVHTHLSRWEVFMQMQHPNLKPINYKAILPFLGYPTKTSCNVGIIKLQGGEYLLGENGEVCVHSEKLISLMKRVEGHNVTVYWLDGNDGKVIKALVYIGNTLMCEAVAKPRYNRAKIEQTPKDHEAREIMSKYVAIIEAYGRNRKRAIEPVTTLDNTPAPNKTFIIPGLKVNAVKAFASGEVMPEPDKYDDFLQYPTIKRQLKDRF
jgi:hypothetical protein